VADCFQSLADALRRETERYRELTALAEEQKKILVSGRVDGLTENVRKQEKILFTLGPLAEERQRFLQDSGRQLGLEKASVTEVATRCPGDEGPLLKAAVKDLVETVQVLDEMGRTNGKLLENAQGYAKFTLEALQGKTSVKPDAPVPNAGLFNRVV